MLRGKHSEFPSNLRKYLDLLIDGQAREPRWGSYVNPEINEEGFDELFSLMPTNKVDRLISEQDFNKHYDLFIAGCSETTGRLLHPTTDKKAEESKHIWGVTPANYLGFANDFLNISSGGISAQGIVNSIFAQIRNNGLPKHILVLFPRLDTRMTIIQDADTLIDKDSKRNVDSIYPIAFASTIGNNILNYVKRPFGVSEVLPQSLAIYINIQSILALETFCKAAGVNLIYSTWNKESNSLLKAANDTSKGLKNSIPFENYLDLTYQVEGNKNGTAWKDLPDSCHLTHKEHPRFYRGMLNHFGIHMHSHIGQDYKEELKIRGF